MLSSAKTRRAPRPRSCAMGVRELDPHRRLGGRFGRAAAGDAGQFFRDFVHRGADVAAERRRDPAQGEQAEQLVAGQLEPAQRVAVLEDVAAAVAVELPRKPSFEQGGQITPHRPRARRMVRIDTRLETLQVVAPLVDGG